MDLAVTSYLGHCKNSWLIDWLITSANKVGRVCVFGSVCVWVCVSVSSITAKVIGWLHWNLMSWWAYQWEEAVNFCWWLMIRSRIQILDHFSLSSPFTSISHTVVKLNWSCASWSNNQWKINLPGKEVHRQPHGLAAGVAGATGSSDRWGGSWGLFAVGSVSSNVQRTCMGYAATQNRACNTITHRTPERCGLVAVGRI